MDKDKCMLTFNVKGRGRGAHTKLRICNKIKSRVTKLISDSKAGIYFFSNIEIGTGFENPHLHVQLWHDDLEAVMAIRKKIIKEFGLVAKRQDVTLPKKCEPQQQPKYYNYTIKDYSADLSDNEVWNLEQTKIRMRQHMGKKLRFISKSKGKYTQKMYKMVYHSFRVLRAFADKFLDLVTSTLFFKKEIIEDLLYSKKFVKSSFVSSFIPSKNKEILFFCIALVVLCYAFVIGVLFYSPSNDPPISLFCELSVRGFMV